MHIDSGVDTGGIVTQRALRYDSRDTVHAMGMQAVIEGTHALRLALARVEDGEPIDAQPAPRLFAPGRVCKRADFTEELARDLCLRPSIDDRDTAPNHRVEIVRPF
jgi:methionyl-tRNA formyltransferase